MISTLSSSIGIVATLPVALVVSWIVRRVLRFLTRRAVRTAERSQGLWRVRLDRVGERRPNDARKRQRADAAARMLGHYATVFIMTVAVFITLNFAGASPLTVLSGAGFLGVALAFGGQDLIQNVIAGTMSVLEDRYAVGDDVVLTMTTGEIEGTIDLIGAASVRLVTSDGASAHVGHNKMVSVLNRSQLVASSSASNGASRSTHRSPATAAPQ